MHSGNGSTATQRSVPSLRDDVASDKHHRRMRHCKSRKTIQVRILSQRSAFRGASSRPSLDPLLPMPPSSFATGPRRGLFMNQCREMTCAPPKGFLVREDCEFQEGITQLMKTAMSPTYDALNWGLSQNIWRTGSAYFAQCGPHRGPQHG